LRKTLPALSRSHQPHFRYRKREIATRKVLKVSKFGKMTSLSSTGFSSPRHKTTELHSL
ncbi:unnamed protein product, partial [Larinioides sclopetarius]